MLRTLILVLALATAVVAAVPGDGDNFGKPFRGQEVDLTTPYARDALRKVLGGLSGTAGGGRTTNVIVVDGHHSAYMSADGTVGVSRQLLELLVGRTIDPKSPASVNQAVYEILHTPRQQNTLETIVAHEIGHHAASDGGTPSPGPDPLRDAIQERRQAIRDALDPAVLSRIKQDFEAEGRRRQEFARGKDFSGNEADANFFKASEGLSNPGRVIVRHVQEYQADQHALLLRYQRTGDIAGSFDFFEPMYQHRGLRASDYTAGHPSPRARFVGMLGYVQGHPEIFGEGLAKPVTVKAPWGGEVKLQMLAGKLWATGLSGQKIQLNSTEQAIRDAVKRGFADYRARVIERGSSGLPSPEAQILNGARAPEPVLAGRNAPRSPGGAGAPAAAGRHSVFDGPEGAAPKGLLGVETETVSRPARFGAGTGKAALSGVAIGLGTNAVEQLIKRGHVDLGETASLLKDPEFWRTTAGSIAGSALGSLVPGGRLLKLAGAIAGASVGGALASDQKPDWKRVAASTVGSIAGGVALGWFPGGALVGGIAGGMVADWAYDKLTTKPAAPKLRDASFLLASAH